MIKITNNERYRFAERKPWHISMVLIDRYKNNICSVQTKLFTIPWGLVAGEKIIQRHDAVVQLSETRVGGIPAGMSCHASGQKQRQRERDI